MCRGFYYALGVKLCVGDCIARRGFHGVSGILLLVGHFITRRRFYYASGLYYVGGFLLRVGDFSPPRDMQQLCYA